MGGRLTIGFLGAGKMATALAQGFARAQLVDPRDIQASDPLEGARMAFAAATGAEISASNRAVVRGAMTLVLAVKPDHVTEVLGELRADFSPEHLLISIVAGATLARLEQALPPGARVIRAMPNTPALVNASATAFALGTSASAPDAELAQRLFSSMGVAFQVKEPLLDAVTGLSGSGPAYAYLMIEALSDGGVAEGLPRDIATQLAAQTLLGSAKMVLDTALHPAVLKDMVASPGGTTVEGLHQLETGNVRGAIIAAVRAAAQKSRNLGRSTEH